MSEAARSLSHALVQLPGPHSDEPPREYDIDENLKCLLRCRHQDLLVVLDYHIAALVQSIEIAPYGYAPGHVYRDLDCPAIDLDHRVPVVFLHQVSSDALLQFRSLGAQSEGGYDVLTLELAHVALGDDQTIAQDNPKQITNARRFLKIALFMHENLAKSP